MRRFFVTDNGQKQGPVPEPVVVASLNAGRWLDAEFTDAETGEVFNARALTHGGTQIITRHDETLMMEARSAQGGPVPQPKFKEQRPSSQPPAEHFAQPFGEAQPQPVYEDTRTLATTAIVVGLFCWPIGLPLAIVARSKAVNAGADTTRANWAIGLNGIWLIMSFLQILKMFAAGEL
jgi:hypothetical protein